MWICQDYLFFNHFSDKNNAAVKNYYQIIPPLMISSKIPIGMNFL